MTPHEFTFLSLFAGAGMGAYGVKKFGGAKLGGDEATWRCLGGVEIDPAACADFEMFLGMACLQADVHQLTPEALVAYCRECPDFVISSPPCQGATGALPSAKAATEPYQLLNTLVFKGINLCCSTWGRPPPFFVIENVPRITTRMKDILVQVRSLLLHYGYRLSEGTHDCGEIGGLAQHRRRYLLVARQPDRVKAYAHRAPKLRVRACGEVLGQLPLPNTGKGGPMHVMSKIDAVTWLRLATIPPGGDHRDLPREGVIALPVLTERSDNWKDQPGRLGVGDWNQPAGAITGSHQVTGSNTVGSVADVRTPEILALSHSVRNGSFSVKDWEGPVDTITGEHRPEKGNAVADVRVPAALAWTTNTQRENTMRVERWDRPLHTITGATRPGSGAPAVADVRMVAIPPSLRSPLAPGQPRREDWPLSTVARWDEPIGTVTTATSIASGAPSVADERVELALECSPRAGVYGVVGWAEAIGTIIGSASVDNGAFAIADPRPGDLVPENLPSIPGPRKGTRYPLIISRDGTWHRPLTPLELACLQGLPAEWKGRPLLLAGKSRTAWVKRIGNGIPTTAGGAIGTSIAGALLASKLGTWFLSNEGVWVSGDGEREDVDFTDQFPSELREVAS